MKRIWILMLTLVLLVSASGVSLAETTLSSDAVLLSLETMFADTDSIQFDFDCASDESIYYMYVSMDGMAAFAMLAKSDDTYKASWTDLTDSLVKLNTSAGELLKLYLPEQTPAIATFLRNDASEDNVVYAVLDTLVVYDPVNGIDLLGLDSE